MFVQSLNKFASTLPFSRSQRVLSATPPALLSRSDWQRIVAEMLD
jgi:hypothetical protein